MNQVSLQYVKNIFNDILEKYKSKFNIDLDYMNVELSELPRFTNGKIDKNMNPDEYSGCHTDLKIIYINPNPINVITHYFPNKRIITDKDVDNFLHTIIAHELAHEVFNNSDDEFKEFIIKDADRNNFTTEYLNAIKTKVVPERFNKEVFCEYMAKIINDKHIKNVIKK